MKWKTKIRPQNGDTKITRRFLVLPCTDDYGNTHWLTIAKVQMRFHEGYGSWGWFIAKVLE